MEVRGFEPLDLLNAIETRSQLRYTPMTAHGERAGTLYYTRTVEFLATSSCVGWAGWVAGCVRRIQESSKHPSSKTIPQILAGACGNRTHRGDGINRPPRGFEDREDHQAPSAPTMQCGVVE